jgi:hypothetical protein
VASGPTITAKFVADTSQLVNEVGKVEQSAGSRLKSFAGKAALALGGAFAVSQVAEFGKASVDAAAADAKAQAILADTMRNVTGATDAQIASTESFLSALSKSTAVADDDLRPALANLIRGFGDAGEAQDALSLATDVSAGTGKDLVSVTEAMAKAALGNTGALGRLGIKTKDAAGHALTLDQIMGDMARTFDGQAARAADTTAGKMANASIQFGEFQEMIGAKLLPIVATLASYFMNTLLPAFEAVVSWIADNKDLVLAAFIGFATVVATMLVPAFIAWAASAAAAAAATLVAAAPFIAIGAVIAAVAFVIIKNWDSIVNATKAAWNAVLFAVRFVWDWIKENWPLLLAVITGPFGLAVYAIVQNFDTIKDAASAVYDWIVDKFNAIANFLSGIVGSIAGAIGRVASAIKGPINAVISGWNAIEFTVPHITLPTVDLGPFGSFGGQSFGGQTFGFPNIPHLAQGGIVTGPTLAVIGEAGPEAIIPLERAGSRTYNLTVNMPVGGDPAMAGRSIVAAIRQYERANGTQWRSAS